MIKGSSFVLRTIREKDLDRLIDLLSDTESQGEFLPIDMVSEPGIRKEFMETGFLTESFMRFMIADTKDNPLGTMWVLKSIPYFDALEIGYMLFSEKNRGKGIMTEALGMLCDYLFKTRKINRLEVRMDVENVASEAVARKAGFTHEGTARQAVFNQGRMCDLHHYALLRSEWVGRDTT